MMNNRPGYQQYHTSTPSSGYNYQGYSTSVPGLSAPTGGYPGYEVQQTTSQAPMNPVSGYSSYNTAGSYYQYQGAQNQPMSGFPQPASQQSYASNYSYADYNRQSKPSPTNFHQQQSPYIQSYTSSKSGSQKNTAPPKGNNKSKPARQDLGAAMDRGGDGKNSNVKDSQSIYIESYLTPGLNIEILPNSTLMCKVCKVSCGQGLKEYFIHMNDSAHGQAVFAHLVPYHADYNRNPKQFLYCEICDERLKFAKAYVTHVFSKSHIKRARQLMQLDAPLKDDSSPEPETDHKDSHSSFSGAMDHLVQQQQKQGPGKQQDRAKGGTAHKDAGRPREQSRLVPYDDHDASPPPGRRRSDGYNETNRASREVFEHDRPSERRGSDQYRKPDQSSRATKESYDKPVQNQRRTKEQGIGVWLNRINTPSEAKDDRPEWSSRARELQRQVGNMSSRIKDDAKHSRGDYPRGQDSRDRKRGAEKPDQYGSLGRDDAKKFRGQDGPEKPHTAQPFRGGSPRRTREVERSGRDQYSGPGPARPEDSRPREKERHDASYPTNAQGKRPRSPGRESQPMKRDDSRPHAHPVREDDRMRSRDNPQARGAEHREMSPRRQEEGHRSNDYRPEQDRKRDQRLETAARNVQPYNDRYREEELPRREGFDNQRSNSRNDREGVDRPSEPVAEYPGYPDHRRDDIERRGYPPSDTRRVDSPMAHDRQPMKDDRFQQADRGQQEPSKDEWGEPRVPKVAPPRSHDQSSRSQPPRGREPLRGHEVPPQSHENSPRGPVRGQDHPRNREFSVRDPQPSPRSHELPPRSHEPSPRSHELPPRSHEPSPRSHELPPRSHEPFPRSHELPPRSNEPSPRSHEFQLRHREPSPRSREFPTRPQDPPPRGHELPPRSSDPSPRSSEFPTRPQDPSPRGHEFPPRSGDPSPRSCEYPPRPHEPSPRSHEFPQRPREPSPRSHGFPSRPQEPSPKRHEPLVRSHVQSPRSQPPIAQEPPARTQEMHPRGEDSYFRGYEDSPRWAEPARQQPPSPRMQHPREHELNPRNQERPHEFSSRNRELPPREAQQHLDRRDMPPRSHEDDRSHEHQLPHHDRHPRDFEHSTRNEMPPRRHELPPRPQEILPGRQEHPSREIPPRRREPSPRRHDMPQDRPQDRPQDMPQRGFEPPRVYDLPPTRDDFPQRNREMAPRRKEPSPRDMARREPSPRREMAPRQELPLRGGEMPPRPFEPTPRSNTIPARHEPLPRNRDIVERGHERSPRMRPTSPRRLSPRDSPHFTGRMPIPRDKPLSRERSPIVRRSREPVNNDRRQPPKTSQRESNDGFGQAAAVCKSLKNPGVPIKSLLARQPPTPSPKNKGQGKSMPASHGGHADTRRHERSGKRDDKKDDRPRGSSLLEPEALFNLRRMGFEGDPEDFVRLVASMGNMATVPTVIDPSTLLGTTGGVINQNFGILPSANPMPIVDSGAMSSAIQIMSQVDPAVLQSLNSGDPRALEMLQNSLSPQMLEKLAALSPQIVQAVGGNIPSEPKKARSDSRRLYEQRRKHRQHQNRKLKGRGPH